MGKNFPFTEKKYLQFRFETFNTTNRVTFGAPNISPTSSAFGMISTQVNSPRAVLPEPQRLRFFSLSAMAPSSMPK